MGEGGWCPLHCGTLAFPCPSPVLLLCITPAADYADQLQQRMQNWPKSSGLNGLKIGEIAGHHKKHQAQHSIVVHTFGRTAQQICPQLCICIVRRIVEDICDVTEDSPGGNRWLQCCGGERRWRWVGAASGRGLHVGTGRLWMCP